MLTATPRIGKIKRIFLSNWQSYRQAHYVRPVEEDNVRKMLCCRTPLYGKHVYACPCCGRTKEIPHSCKSRFCSVCGYLSTTNWVESRFCFLLDCWYHHVVVTVPATYRWMIKRNRKAALNLMVRCAVDTLQEWAKGRGYELGIVVFFHSFGRNLQFHPHFHMLVTAGGLKLASRRSGLDGSWYYTDSEIPGKVLMPIFKTKFTVGMKQLFRDGILTTQAPLSRVLYQIGKSWDSHWQFYTERITKKGAATMTYCVRYAKKMILSEHRIIDFDGKQVTFFDSKKKKVLVYDVNHFIRVVVQHIPEKHFKLIRYYGFYANKSGKKYDQARRYWNSLDTPKEKHNWRWRQWKRDRKDPLFCLHCKIDYQLSHVILPQAFKMLSFKKILIANGIEIKQQLKLEYG